MPILYSNDFRMAVIKYYQQNIFSIKSAVNIFSVSKSSIYNWINLYSNNQILPLSNIRKKYNCKITGTIKKYIVDYVLKHTFNFNIKKLKLNIKNIFNIFVCKSRIYAVIREEKLSYKKISDKLVYKSEKKDIKKLLNKIKRYDSDNIISIDETSIDTHIKTNKGWGPVGKKIVKKN